MTEVAAAASVVGLITFGVQTLQAINEARRVLSTLKNAPSTLIDLLDKTSHLQTLLSALAQQHQEFAQYAIPSPVWAESLRRCQCANETLNRAALDLKDKIKGAKLRGSVKFLMKKDTLAGYQAQLDATKVDLLLAQTSVGAAVQCYQLAQSLKMTKMLEQAGSSGSLALVRQPYGVSEQPVGSERVDDEQGALDRRKRRQGKLKRDTTFEITIGHRWIGRLFKVQLGLSSNSLGLQLVAKNIVPWNSKVFNAAYYHDVDTLRRLFQTGQASIHDVNEEGLSLLEWAMIGRLDSVKQNQSLLAIAKFLIDSGFRFGQETLFYFWHMVPCDPEFLLLNEAAVGSTISFLTSNSEYSSIDLPQRSSFGFYYKGVHNSETALKQILQSLEFSYNAQPFAHRLYFAFRENYFNPRIFFVYLGQDHINKDCLQFWSTPESWAEFEEPQYKTLVAKIAKCSADGYYRDQWTALLRSAAEIGGVEVAYRREESPLFIYLRAYDYSDSRSWERLCSTVASDMSKWLDMLVAADQDLLEVGHWECELLQRQDRPDFAIYLPQKLKFQVTGLTYGPRVEDWKLWLSNPLDEWASDFWELVDSGPELRPPGAWIDEEEEREARRRAEPGEFPTLATSRRKRRRYLRMMEMTDDEAQAKLGLPWIHMCDINKNHSNILLYRRYIEWPACSTDPGEQECHYYGYEHDGEIVWETFDEYCARVYGMNLAAED